MKVSSSTNDESFRGALAAWATKGLPARIDVPTTARVLGFATHDIPILMSAGKLEALGNPAPNAPKWFCAVEVIQLAADREWLDRASREVCKYWRQKRSRRTRLASAGRDQQGTRNSKDRVKAEAPLNEATS